MVTLIYEVFNLKAVCPVIIKRGVMLTGYFSVGISIQLSGCCLWNSKAGQVNIIQVVKCRVNLYSIINVYLNSCHLVEISGNNWSNVLQM